jgi:hypothetical protein
VGRDLIFIFDCANFSPAKKCVVLFSTRMGMLGYGKSLDSPAIKGLDRDGKIGYNATKVK